VDIQKSFTYQFDDEQWSTKLGIGALISLVPILNFAIVGYMVAIIRNVANHAARPLPDWDDLGSRFRDGLLLTLAGFVYAAPALILFFVLFGTVAATAAASQNGRFQELGRALTVPGVILIAVVITLLLIYSLLLSIIRPIIMVLFSREGTFASCFRLGEIMRLITQRARPFFTTWLVVIVAGTAIGLIVGFANLLVGWIPCLGWLASLVLALGAAIYLITLDAHLFGQFRLAAYEEGREKPAI
jgi:Protein of unknown function (DUF4013)